MKLPFGLRLWILIGALVFVAGGIIYGLSAAWRRAERLEAALNSSNSSRIKSFRLAGQIQRKLLELDNSMLRYAILRDSNQWHQFEQTSSELDDWIDSRDPNLNPESPLTTKAEQKLFQELNLAYDDYRSVAALVHSNAQPALVSSRELSQLDKFDGEARRMRRLAKELEDAHRTAEAGFLSNANAALAHLRTFLAVSVALLLILVAAMGWVIYRDLIAPLRTKLVLSQNLLERQEKLATLGTLAAGIAHEIRNPLTSLKARLYTLEKHLQAVPAARKDTDIISAEISRLERVVQEVLSFARPADPKLETIAADTLLREVQGLMAPNLENRGVHLTLEVTPDLFVRADSGHLKQVLINLARNAGEAIEGSGTVSLRARSARASIGGREVEAVILEVSDTGNGIPLEAQKRLFDPFFSTKETGTGLGLPIAARIVERHGGTLQYQTRIGFGTTFGIVLPREIEDSAVGAQGVADKVS